MAVVRSDSAGAPAAIGARPRKALTIGAVCKILAASSTTSRSRRSATSRTRSCSRRAARQGGYRLYSQADVERLRTILRLQRDEFLPLRVIRQELAAGGDIDLGGGGGDRGPPAGAVGGRSSSTPRAPT